MQTYRIPILVSQDHQGCFTAIPAEVDLADGNSAAFDETSAGALNQLKAYFLWWYKNHRYCRTPDFHEPELMQLPIDIRPEYQERDRSFPCRENVSLKFPCIKGRTEGGLHVCSLPTLSLCFHVYEPDNLQEIALQRIAESLARATPRHLTRFLPSRETRVEILRLRIPSTHDSEKQFTPHLPTLGRIAQPLGKPSVRKHFRAAWQRESELADLVRRLAEEKANVVLVGEHGVGKSTLLVNAVRAIERRWASESDDDDTENSATPRHRHRFWLTNAARVIAGMAYLGEWQERCEELIDELSSIGGVLCVESLVNLLLYGGQEPNASIASFLLPYFQSGELRIVGEATPTELQACRRLLPGFADVFQVLQVNELKKQRARDALTQLAETHTRDMKVTFEDQTIETVCRLFQRFLPYRALPGRAAGFVSELFDDAKQRRREQIRVTDVVEYFRAETGLPEKLLRDDQPLECESILDELTHGVIGQDEPCQIVAEQIATFKAGLNDPGRPLGTFLFSGPTGVGKTELAKRTSQFLFGAGSDKDRLIRLDMSEYSSPYAAERLLMTESGAPSQLINRVRRQPFVVILFDEIEKAAPQVFDMMLGLLDEGRLTDRNGRTTNFCSALIIMTSNLGTSSRQPIGFGRGVSVAKDADIRSFFRPEFFNRIDAVVSFRPLSFQTCTRIVQKELREIANREGFMKANLILEFTNTLVDHLAQEGFDDRYGARPLQRTLETRVVSALSRHLINHPGLRDATLKLEVADAGNVVVR